MTLNEEVVRWAVDGQPTTSQNALEALSTRPLLLLMHGYGASEGDLIGLTPHLPSQFVCASPRAPLNVPGPAFNGYAWFPIEFSTAGIPLPQPEPEQFVGSHAHSAAVATLRWLDTLDARVPNGLGSIALMGFSQGGAMATSLMRMRPERFSAGVNCSGFVAGGSYPGDATLAEIKPPMFWGSDPADPIVTESRLAYSREWFPAHTRLEQHTYSGIAHSISYDEVADIHAFLSTHVQMGSIA